MNVAKHMAWAMNPNLSDDDFQQLVEKDCQTELERVCTYLDGVSATLADTSLSKESRRTLALEQLSYLPTLLCL